MAAGRSRKRRLCYNASVPGKSSEIIDVRGKPLKRLVLPVLTLVALLIMTSCGGGSSSNTPTTSGVKNRAFISNTYTGNLQVVNSQNDTTNYSSTTTTSSGQIIQGAPVTITAGFSVTWMVEGPNNTQTMVYDNADHALIFLNNAGESINESVVLSDSADMAVFSSDGNTVYAPVRNAHISGSRNGGVQVLDLNTGVVTVTYSVPSAHYVAMSPGGTYLLVFADNSDSVVVFNLSASPVSRTTIPGFAAPVNALFSSDGNTAYVLNCGPECGSANPPSVMSLDLGSKTIKATVPVGGASVGYLNSNTLYVAGTPGANGSFDSVDVSTMTRQTANSVAIGDGYHSTMALNNNKLYIGAKTCSNTSTGCLSVVNISTNVADAPLPPRGAITSMISVANRNVMYVVEGGYLHIYDTDTDDLQATQLGFTGALYGVIQVDP
jgi:hypothetical protein